MEIFFEYVREAAPTTIWVTVCHLVRPLSAAEFNQNINKPWPNNRQRNFTQVIC